MDTNKWTQLADEASLQTAIKALNANGFETIVVENGEAAKAKVMELIPANAEVMSGSSTTLDQIGLTKEIMESGKYDSVKAKLMKMDRKTQSREMRKLGAAPDYMLGSVHAVTEDGVVFIASASGSQLPPYAYAAGKVIWVVSTKKIVKNQEDGMKRLYEHVLPLESERAHKAYGVPGSSVNKLLIFHKENPGRITIIFVKEALGF